METTKNVNRNRKNNPRNLLIRNDLIFAIFIDCNTIRLIYFEENYEYKKA